MEYYVEDFESYIFWSTGYLREPSELDMPSIDVIDEDRTFLLSFQARGVCILVNVVYRH